MNIIRPVLLASSLIVALGFSSTAGAATIVCPDDQTLDREITVDDVALACSYGLGNPKETDISDDFGGLTFINEGELAGSDGTNSMLTATVTGGSWGSAPASGTFSIAEAFWSLYDTAVLSFHVGNGGGDPDYMAFSLINGTTGSTWAYEKLQGAGGGLSNIKLWGATGSYQKPPVEVTEPAQLGILLVGVLGLIAARRRQH